MFDSAIVWEETPRRPRQPLALTTDLWIPFPTTNSVLIGPRPSVCQPRLLLNLLLIASVAVSDNKPSQMHKSSVARIREGY